jgi:hypothetical protein
MNEPHPRFPVEDHILNIGGDALLHYKFERKNTLHVTWE